MHAIRKQQRSSRGMRGSAKTEGKIEVDDTCVRRKTGLHEGRGSTRRVPRVPLPESTSRRRSNFRVPSAPQCEHMRRNACNG
jgi:hypothetical protein